MLKEIVQNLNVRFLTVDSYLGGTFILGIPKKAKFDTFVGSIPPILNFIPLPSQQELYCKTALASLGFFVRYYLNISSTGFLDSFIILLKAQSNQHRRHKSKNGVRKNDWKLRQYVNVM